MPAAPALARGLAIVAALVATAQAERATSQAVAHRPQPMVKRIPRTDAPTNAGVTSRIVYLNRCSEAIGCTLRSGNDDARTDTSGIVDSGIKTLGGFTQGDQVWDEMAACVRATFAPFDIQITTTDPGNVPHFMNVVGGRPSDITSDPEFQDAGGLALWNCNEIPNAVTYTFDVYGPDPLQLCWTSAQEIAHAFGLEHALLQKDPMTYVGGDLPKRFRDAEATCGERTGRACACGSPTQNSYRRIVEMFGPGAPTPPEVGFTRPAEGKVIQPGYKALVSALDDVRVEKVDVYADGALVGTSMTPVGDNFAIVIPDLGVGEHTLEARATDVQGVVNTTSIVVTAGPPCTADTGCTGSDVCAGGVCVPGPEEAGGLGDLCQTDGECLSNRCADAGQGAKYCVETCQLGNAASCPSEFACVAAGAEGVCWPSPGGGCCDAGGDGHGALLLGGAVLAIVLRRRRTP